MIETDEMVHVGMGDKDMGDLKDIAWGQSTDIAQVEKQRPVFMAEGNEQGRVLERAVDQSG